MLKELIEIIKPKSVLDLGCRDGSFTHEFSRYCGKITSIDINPKAIEKARAENPGDNIEYMVMDGRNLDFSDGSFDVVLERDSLHHIEEWRKALSEMLRVSGVYVLIEEPLDDPRSQAKRNSMKAQDLFLKMQREAGFSHYNYIKVQDFQDYFKEKGINFEMEIEKSDELSDFDEYFEYFDEFARKTDRNDYWMKRLEDFRAEMKGEVFCHSDRIFIKVRK